ncbi:MAG TPA: recombinase family protein, partial [Methylocystis sp.]|nr:recombinase family protein [Methylocystis sp.]
LFDDPGYSGGNMERPALKRLLADIAAKKIDIVIVYKVDRLTRSLADFAKLVEAFDAHGVAFVSVTQAFNTTTSMGRLTLNVLLSFAQFEREVTGERIRDKIAASKQKGLWMGGVVPHGYRVEDRKLLVVEEEAEVVRLIFDLYLLHGSIRTVQRELRARDIRTRERALASGRKIGGVSFTNGPIAHILRNRCYIGEISHKGKCWPGEHAPIVDLEIFNRVQERLLEQRRFRLADRAKSQALLIGKIFNDVGDRMTPSYALKQGVRYRYYISVSAMQSRERPSQSVHRISAAPIEAIVVETLTRAERDRDRPEHARAPMKADAALDGQLTNAQSRFPELEAERRARELVDDYLERVVVHPDRLEIVRRKAGDDECPSRTLVVPWTKPSQTRRREILQPEGADAEGVRMGAAERTRLLRAIATARSWLDELIAGAVPDFACLAAREGKSERSVRMTLSLAFLDPALIKAAAQGRLPRGHGVSRLVDPPPRFEDQWRSLGLVRSA